MRRRLDLAAALVARPPVLFLDEPTTGLDPRSRIELWGVIEDLVGEGTTLLLTTQYLEEADRLADRIAVIDHGRVIARGHRRPSSRRSSAASVVEVGWPTRRRAPGRPGAGGLGEGEATVEDDTARVTVPVDGGAGLLREVRAARWTPRASRSRHRRCGGRRLDDVFLALTGHAAEDDAEARAATTGAEPAGGR